LSVFTVPARYLDKHYSKLTTNSGFYFEITDDHIVVTFIVVGTFSHSAPEQGSLSIYEEL